jgi:hypothetical protein
VLLVASTSVLEQGVDHSGVGCRISLLKIAQTLSERNKETHVRCSNRELVVSKTGSTWRLHNSLSSSSLSEVVASFGSRICPLELC